MVSEEEEDFLEQLIQVKEPCPLLKRRLRLSRNPISIPSVTYSPPRELSHRPTSLPFFLLSLALPTLPIAFLNSPKRRPDSAMKATDLKTQSENPSPERNTTATNYSQWMLIPPPRRFPSPGSRHTSSCSDVRREGDVDCCG